VPLQAGPQFPLFVDEFADAGQGVVVTCHGSSVPAVRPDLARLGRNVGHRGDETRG
jgi:hypothetical protein